MRMTAFGEKKYTESNERSELSMDVDEVESGKHTASENDNYSSM